MFDAGAKRGNRLVGNEKRGRKNAQRFLTGIVPTGVIPAAAHGSAAGGAVAASASDSVNTTGSGKIGHIRRG